MPAAISASMLRPVDETMRTSTVTFVAAADALEGLVDQHAQDLVLRLARHVGDLIDEQRAAMGFLERADLAALRAVADLDAEQLDLHVLRRDRGGIDDDERPVGARRERWIVRAASSLPAPDGPTINTRLLVGATFSMIWRSWFIAGDVPTSVDASGRAA